MPLLGDPGHQELVLTLQKIAGSFTRPKAIIVVSAHWEAGHVKVTTGKTPALIYDYHNFPPEAYRIHYPCDGDSNLAREVIDAVNAVGLHVEGDPSRGFDHGHFVPLKIMYPDADIPTIQVSLVHSLSPQSHLLLGRSLSGLIGDGVMLLGSGFSFHNMKAFFEPPNANSVSLNESFEQWLHDTLTDPQLSEGHRSRQLENWSQAPGARYCHPREEHLLPLHVCYGAAQSVTSEAHSLTVLNKKASMFVW